MKNETIKAALAEAFGTFDLVFIGGFAVASAQGVGVAALAHGLIVAGIIYMWGHFSGAHVNPAVTAGLLVGGQIKLNRAVLYWVAQFAGAIVAAALLNIIVPGTNIGQTTGSLTENSVWAAALLEALLTFVLVTVVYQAAVYGKAGNLAGVAIGFTLTALILAGGTYTGAALNPARLAGPALVAGDFSYLIPYLVGIFGGAAAAGLTNTYIFKAD
jgi:glycerol uptake facilitator-like aquaporin